MIFTSKKYPKKSIVWRCLDISGLPYKVIIVRDPKIGGFTAYMTNLPQIVVDKNTVKEAIDALIKTYNIAKKYGNKFLKPSKK